MDAVNLERQQKRDKVNKRRMLASTTAHWIVGINRNECFLSAKILFSSHSRLEDHSWVSF